MMIAKFISALAAAVFASAPVAAAPTYHASSKLLSKSARAGAENSDRNGFIGGTTLIAIPLAVIAAFVAYHIFVDDSDDVADSN